MRWLAVVLLCACAPHAPRSLPEPDAQLHVVDVLAGKEHTLVKRELGEPQLVAGFDPYYQREKRFWAVPLAPLLQASLPGELATADLVFHATDGYTVPFVGSKLLDGTAWLALADADHPSSWESIGPRRADPAPFYVVWSGPDRENLERYPRPWALAKIERVQFEQLYPHTVPTAGNTLAKDGYALFRKECFACHAINREGGRIGPDLNVPQSIVEYRPRDQIRAYIRDPLTFRYGTMPSHPDLTEADLDALLAYFDDLKTKKSDPEHAK